MPNNLTVLEGLPGLKLALGRKIEELRAASALLVAEEVSAIEADARKDAPVDTGELEGDIEPTTDGLYGQVKSTSQHSVFQEFGTSRNAAQPFMRPAAERARQRIPAKAAAMLRAALRGR